MPTRLLPRLSMTARLPLAVAAVVLVTAAGTTQIAVQGLTRQVERQLDRMGQIYLDGLAAALLPPAIRGDQAGIDRALDEALRMHQGLVDRRLFLVNGAGKVLARADRPGLPDTALPEGVTHTPRGNLLDEDDGSYWIWRPLSDDRLSTSAGTQTMVANLDVTDYVTERRQLWRRVVAFNLLLGVGFALLGLVLLRRLLRPVTLLTRHLQHGVEGVPVPVPADQVPQRDRETAQLVQAYNRMTSAMQERETLLAHMANQEREALLGRMAATLAHEVRNPLAGVLTAIETLRKFGDQPQARSEALDFMERGMRALAGVTDATLATHRPAADALDFGPQDLQDVQRLVEPQARQAGVTLVVESDLAQAVPVAGNELRQVLLNLLLNALEASAAGGQVTLRCRLQPDRLRLEVQDQGAGLPDHLAQGLQSGTEPAGEAGLGVAVVVRLVQQLRGRVNVTAHPAHGTHIVLELPLVPSVHGDALT